MKNFVFGLLALFMCVGVSLAQEASIAGAAAFKKPAAVQAPAPVQKLSAFEQKKQAKEAEVSRKTKEKKEAYLRKNITQVRAFNNPRYVKDLYGREKGQQQAIQAVQEEELNKKTYATVAEKDAARAQIESRALVKFQDFEGDENTIKKQMNQNPADSVIDMVERTTYQDGQVMTPAYSEHIAGKVEQIFVDNEGMTSTQYRKLYAEQLEQAAELQNEKVVDDFIEKEETVVVEKVDDNMALIRVGAPKTKLK